MKVALVTSGDERCGIAEYGKNLMKHLPQIKWQVIGHDSLRGQTIDADIMHLNYEPGLFPNVVHAHTALNCTIPGAKKVLTLHTSQERGNSSRLTDSFDRIVVHEDTYDTRNVPQRWTKIPMGIPDRLSREEISQVVKLVHDLGTFDVASVGFPFPWKGFHQVALAANEMHWRALFIIPRSRHADAEAMARCLHEASPDCTCVLDWLDEREVIKMLRLATINVFNYHGGNFGISGAVRLGLATDRQVVVSRSRQFRDLFDYPNEIGFIEDPTSVSSVRFGLEALLPEKNTNTDVRSDMSWEASAQKYLQVYEEVLNG